MCGIAGIFAYSDSAPPVDREEFLRIREHMIKRGPDGAGLWTSDNRRIGLAHRRLSIIDLSEAGAQPMDTADGQFRITFNGEIYNYRALRKEMEGRGYRFRTNSDTEVLLHLYADRGADMVHALRGMYAFAIWDARKQRLFLARDPFGIKPLYYADDGHSFRCASQVRALVAGKGIDLAPDPAGSAGFLLWGFVPDPFTLYRAVQALPAGCWMTVDANGAGEPRKFFDLAAEYRQAEEVAGRLSKQAALDRLSEVLADSVAYHMVADVPVGVFLSAGIDSSAIATLAARSAGSDLRCVTLGFEEHRGGPNDETVLAAETARRLGARHDIDWIGKQAFYDEIPDVMAAMDQPSIDGINTYFVARAAARQNLKVALSGLGGDEILHGYPSFRDVPRMVRSFAFANRWPRWAGRFFRAVSSPMIRRFTSPKYAGLLEYGGTHEGAYLLRRGLFMPWELPRLLGRKIAREGWERLQTIPALRATRAGLHRESSIVSCFELAWYMRSQLLRDADWAGMAHSLEIRVPFVDLEVLRAVTPLVAAGAISSKRDFAGLPALGLPSTVIDKPKTGFLAPVREWLNEMAPARSKQRGLCGWARKLLRQQTARRAVLVLLTDGFGGIGGIAQFNRELLRATCSDPANSGVVALPRLMPRPPEEMPANLEYVTAALGGRLRYAAALLRTLARHDRFDLIVCGHINLLPLAWIASVIARSPILLVIHGIDAWNPTRSALTNWLARRVHAVASVSKLSLDRFQGWSGVPYARCIVLPNAVRIEKFGTGPRDERLVARYGLRGRTVIMTLGRLEASERLKGVDEVINLMPRLLNAVPEIAYLIIGEGTDKERLQKKAATLGLAGYVTFAGHVAEAEKADHFRLADAYVMPSRGEGFGIVFLEAMACGIPVVGSKADGGREALGHGALGQLVDPTNATELEDAILKAVRGPKWVPEGIEYFSFENFERRCHRLMVRTSMLSG